MTRNGVQILVLFSEHYKLINFKIKCIVAIHLTGVNRKYSHCYCLSTTPYFQCINCGNVQCYKKECVSEFRYQFLRTTRHHNMNTFLYAAILLVSEHYKLINFKIKCSVAIHLTGVNRKYSHCYCYAIL
jgi:hypothetical protein